MKTVLVFLMVCGLLSANGQALPQEPNSQDAAIEAAHGAALSSVKTGQTRVRQEMAVTGGASACGFDREFGTQAQADCGDILDALKKTYGISWDAPADPAIRLYDFGHGGLRRWRLADAQALKDALDAWSRALGGVDEARRQLGLNNLMFKLRGQKYMLIPGDLGEYIDAWDEIDMGGTYIQAVDFAHELAHRWERHGDSILGQVPSYRTLRFTLKFYAGYASTTDTWAADGSGWTRIARGKDGHYSGARPEEDFAETASHVVMQTQIAQQYQDSERYRFMIALMPGLQQSR
jgi:hypothetical protein